VPHCQDWRQAQANSDDLQSVGLPLSRYLTIQPDQAGFAPGVPHLTNLPFGPLQRTGFFGVAVAHLMNLPFASRQGAATAGAIDPTAKARVAVAMAN
jgi:hypothetical protein